MDSSDKAFVILKPEALKNRLVGAIISRLENSGLKIISIKSLKVSDEQAKKLYPNTKEQLKNMGLKTLSTNTKDEVLRIFGTTDPYEIGRIINEWNRKYIKSDKVICVVLQGENALEKVKKIVGHTDPAKAERGTIRGDFSNDSIFQANKERRACKNLVHRADSIERVEEEISIFFKGDEI